ncbi:glutamate--tRNA ligase [Candidatus Uhrbacteria bacterium]|nr:glutamate--tRNA ligase [Candidatus Uhrbacteria bacterium]
MNVKTRFPPSPTGSLHIGSLRTALYNYYFAKKHGGTFVLRIEDTDQARSVPGAVESLIRTLARMDISYDEGPYLQDGHLVEKGPNGPYTQSNRLNTYRTHAMQLIEQQQAYYCFCTKKRLETLRESQQATKRPTKYDRKCLQLTQAEIDKQLDLGTSYVIRMKIPEGKTIFQDEIRGTVVIDHAEVDDQVLLKADGFPTYHLAVVVDDHAMGVTHIIRGEEWLSSVPKHVLLYGWFGFDLPVFAHLPLILNPDKSKLSKRQGDVSVEDYLAKGYLEEALSNYVSLLGFNPTSNREIYTRDEFIEAFNLKKINKSGAVFDVNKLLWMNGQYIKQLSGAKILARSKPFIEEGGGVDEALGIRAMEIEKTRIQLLSEVKDALIVYTMQPMYAADLLVWKKSTREDAKEQLLNLRVFLNAKDSSMFDTAALIEKGLKRYIEDNGLKNGNVLWPLRVALSGQERSAGPHEFMWVLGKQETLKRIDHAISQLT